MPSKPGKPLHARVSKEVCGRDCPAKRPSPLVIWDRRDWPQGTQCHERMQLTVLSVLGSVPCKNA